MKSHTKSTVKNLILNYKISHLGLWKIKLGMWIKFYMYVFCYSADHEDQDVMMFNRITLPAYYGLLRMCCQQSRQFTRQLAQHQNILWAFKNITPYPGQYPGVSLCFVVSVLRVSCTCSTSCACCSSQSLKNAQKFWHHLFIRASENQNCV